MSPGWIASYDILTNWKEEYPDNHISKQNNNSTINEEKKWNNAVTKYTENINDIPQHAKIFTNQIHMLSTSI